MKTGLKVFLGILVGFAGGFASGYFFHKKVNDVEFEEVTEEEMALLEAQAEAQQKTEPVKDEKICKADVKSVQELPENPDKMRLALQGKKSYVDAENEAKTAYAKIWNTVKDYSSEENANEMPIESVEEGFDEQFLEMLEEEEVDPGKIQPPFQIGLVDFYNDRPEYDKVTIDWYEPDNTFIDEREQVIGDIQSYVGDLDISKVFRELNPDTDDPDICFIRNEQYSSDYEIIRHKRSYHEAVGGEE
jgi:hypothetical protein